MVATTLIRDLRSTLLLLAGFLGLLAYIYFVESKRPSSSEPEPTENVFSIETDSIVALQITADNGEITTLETSDGIWKIVSPRSLDADVSEISAITSSLSSLSIQRVVEEASQDLEPFGLIKPQIDVAFRLNEAEEFKHLLIGRKTPTGGNLYASVEGEKRVFLISGFLDNTFNRTTFDLRNKAVLRFDRDTVDALEITGNDRTIRLEKGVSEWFLTAPWKTRGDYAIAEGLLGRLSTVQMQSIVMEETSTLDEFGLEHPEITVTASAGGSLATLMIGEESPDNKFYARDTTRPMVFTIDTALVNELNKEASEYRRKELFEFRPFNSNRLEINHDDQIVTFEKIENTEDQEDQWRQLNPSRRDVERDRMDDLLTKLSNLRASSFIESRANTGLASPLVTITVQFGEDNKEESVILSKHEHEVFGSHVDEPGAAKINLQAFDETLDALDKLK